MQTIKQLLDKKGNNIHSISPNHSVYDAIQSMADHQIGSLLVLEKDNLVGIITERDYSRKVILKGKASKETPIREVMTCNVVCTKARQSIEECMALMTEKRVRHLPVIENNKVIGLISIGDLVKTIIDEQKFIIEQLEHYINA